MRNPKKRVQYSSSEYQTLARPKGTTDCSLKLTVVSNPIQILTFFKSSKDCLCKH